MTVRALLYRVRHISYIREHFNISNGLRSLLPSSDETGFAVPKGRRLRIDVPLSDPSQLRIHLDTLTTEGRLHALDSPNALSQSGTAS